MRNNIRKFSCSLIMEGFFPITKICLQISPAVQSSFVISQLSLELPEMWHTHNVLVTFFKTVRGILSKNSSNLLKSCCSNQSILYFKINISKTLNIICQNQHFEKSFIVWRERNFSKSTHVVQKFTCSQKYSA